jgi:hypothetical protein
MKGEWKRFKVLAVILKHARARADDQTIFGGLFFFGFLSDLKPHVRRFSLSLSPSFLISLSLVSRRGRSVFWIWAILGAESFVHAIRYSFVFLERRFFSSCGSRGLEGD